MLVVVSAFLKKELRKLHVNDPFELLNSEAIVDYLQSGVSDGFKAFSVDVGNLYYSLPRQDLRRCVKACIFEDNDEQKFPPDSGATVGGFMELLIMYLQPTIVIFEGQVLFQKPGVCVGSYVTPLLSRIFFGRVDVSIKECLQDDACRIYRYEHNYLIFVRGEEPKFKLHDFLNVFDKCWMA